jgi:hypothetical protein
MTIVKEGIVSPTEAQPTVPPPARMVQLLHGKLVAQAICAAAELRIADHLAETPQSAETLARATGTHAPSLYRLLRLLASVGIFNELHERTFAHTELSLTLKSNVPGSVQPIACMIGAEWHAVAETKMMHSLYTGETAFGFLHGKGVFEYLHEDAPAGRLFDTAMTGLTQAANYAINQAYDFSWARNIVDVGGGHGSLLSSILLACPNTRGIVFDAPSVVAGAADTIGAAGLNQRCRPVGGDFFSSVPPDGDLYILKHILHDWNDQAALSILRSCRAAASGRSKLLVVEDLVGVANAPSSAKITDIEMLVIFGGCERTIAEYPQVLERADFKLERTIQTVLPLFVLEAAPV